MWIGAHRDFFVASIRVLDGAFILPHNIPFGHLHDAAWMEVAERGDDIVCRNRGYFHLDILGEQGLHSPRMSTKEERIELLQGTLGLLILRTLLLGPAHGHAIAKAIEIRSEDVLQVEQGSLYPVLSKNSICLRVRQLATKVWCAEESTVECYDGPYAWQWILFGCF
jgi:hypothetical protein